MKITVEPRRPNKNRLWFLKADDELKWIVNSETFSNIKLWYLKADDEIIKKSFSKKKLLAIKQKLEEGIIDIDDVKKQYILESDISKWENEL